MTVSISACKKIQASPRLEMLCSITHAWPRMKQSDKKKKKKQTVAQLSDL